MERTEYLNRPANLELGRKLRNGVWVVTALVWVLVGLMRRPELKIPLPEGVSFGFLPPVYSILNVIVAFSLVVALVMIKKGNVMMHQRAISVAMIGSGCFLLLYVIYHFTMPETKYGGEGVMKIAYLTILFSHIFLAAVSLPFILLTWTYGFTSQFGKHRKMARWVFPMWLYVAVTGPVCYLMLRPFYQ